LTKNQKYAYLSVNYFYFFDIFLWKKEGKMSTPQIIACWTCGNSFTFLRGTLTKCPHCGEEYMSHRDAGKITEKKDNLQNKRREDENGIL